VLKRILIIGASKGIGFEAVKQALEAGYEVCAFSRSADKIALDHEHLEKRPGDALNPEDIVSALNGVDVVILTLGISIADMFKPVSLFSGATQILLQARNKAPFDRLIAVTGFGAGESKTRINLIQQVPFQVIFSRAYDDKSRQEGLIKESSTNWTIARPGILTNGPKSGRYKVLMHPHQWRNGVISRADAADFLIRSIDDNATYGKAPVLVY
jgi:putative NADH-flavin reductase